MKLLTNKSHAPLVIQKFLFFQETKYFLMFHFVFDEGRNW